MSDKAATKSTYRRGAKYARLAPLDHIKNLYAGANAAIPDTGKPRRVFQKRDLVEAVRHVSPVKSVLAAQSKPQAERGVTTDGPMPDGLDSTTRALIDLEDGVNHNARRYNDLRELGDRKQAELDRLLDQLNELEVENKALMKIEAKSTPMALRIQELEAEIDDVKDRMDNKLMQKAQYEHMMRRLKRNQVAFDAHIKGMDNALKASKKEYDEVHNLMRQLENSKQEALRGLNKYETQLAAADARRKKELAERRTEAANARRMEEWRKQREAKRAEMAAELRGDLTAEQEQALLQELQDREGESEQLKAASRERARKAMTLEQAFMQIRQATGVTTLDEMVQKFMGQGANKKALEDEKAEAERRLANIKAHKEEAEAEFAKLKASDIGGTELSRERIAKYDAEIAAARAQLKVSKAACDRLESVLVAVRQGALGLVQRLEVFDFLDDGPEKPSDDYSSDSGASETKQTAQDTLENLQKAERKLVKMLDAMEQAALTGPRPTEEETRRTRSAAGTRPDPLIEDRRPWTPHYNSDPKVHINNVRITSTLRRRMEARSAPVSSDDEDDDDGKSEDPKRVENRAELKRRAKKRFIEEQRKRDAAKKREHHPPTSSKRAAQRQAISRLASSKAFSPGMAFLTQKPDLL